MTRQRLRGEQRERRWGRERPGRVVRPETRKEVALVPRELAGSRAVETAARAAEARVATLAVPAEAAAARSEGSARRSCLDTPRRQRRWAT